MISKVVTFVARIIILYFNQFVLIPIINEVCPISSFA